MKNIADCAICMPSDETPRIQECHILTGHIICEIAELALIEDPGDLAEKDTVAVASAHGVKGIK
jgi:hypothetical protein